MKFTEDIIGLFKWSMKLKMSRHPKQVKEQHLIETYQTIHLALTIIKCILHLCKHKQQLKKILGLLKILQFLSVVDEVVMVG